MAKIVTICLLVVGVINLLPVIGVISARHLESAYSISLVSKDMIILMRHRALLFGIIGLFVVVSAFYESYQTPSIVMAGASMIGFVVLTLLVGGYNSAIYKVLIADIVGIIVLALGAVVKYGFKNH